MVLKSGVNFLSSHINSTSRPASFSGNGLERRRLRVTMDKQLQQIPRMARRPHGVFRDSTLKPKFCQVQAIHKRVHEADGIICADIFIQRFWKQDQLVAIGTFDMTHAISFGGY
jgi:hypothetical protein